MFKSSINSKYFIFIFLNLFLTILIYEQSSDEDDQEILTNEISYWGFDYVYDKFIYDSVGNNDGIVNGCKIADGVNKQCLSFDGVNDYVEVFDDSTLDIIDAVSVSAWFKIRSLETSEWHCICDKGGYDPDFIRNYGLFINKDGFAHLSFVDINGDRFTITTENNRIKENRWYNIVGIINCVDNIMKLYIDGKLEELYYISSTYMPKNDLSLNIGYLYSETYGNLYLNGYIDELHIYEKPLSSGQIDELYNIK
jgi:hypothetical protein